MRLITYARLKRMLLGFTVILLIVYAAVCLAYAHLLHDNTLVNNGNWVSTKEGLGIKVMGASSFMRGVQALAGKHLNLDAWHGYQEVVSREEMRLERVHFDFLLVKDAYFALIFKAEGHVWGIRLSGSPVLKNIYFEAGEDGAFTEERELNVPRLPIGSWNHCVFYREGEGAKLVLNGNDMTEIGPMPLPFTCRPGFRGCERHVAIDNVALGGVGGRVLDDPFLNDDHLFSNILKSIMILVMINFAFYYSQHVFKVLDARFGLSLLLFNVLVAVMATVNIGLVQFSANFYPFPWTLDRAEERYLFNVLQWRRDEILHNAAAEGEAHPRRILFIGSSQTFGSGAETEDDTFVNGVQRRLDALAGGPAQYECINAGINGATLSSLLPYYENDFMELEPAAAVVNLGINDRATPTEEYESNLRRLIALNREHNILTLLVIEARSWEWAEDYAVDPQKELCSEMSMRKIAAELGVPIVDANTFLKENRQKGFIWWDFVHPTTFGHSLIADAILPELQKLLAGEGVS